MILRYPHFSAMSPIIWLQIIFIFSHCCGNMNGRRHPLDAVDIILYFLYLDAKLIAVTDERYTILH